MYYNINRIGLSRVKILHPRLLSGCAETFARRSARVSQCDQAASAARKGGNLGSWLATAVSVELKGVSKN